MRIHFKVTRSANEIEDTFIQTGTGVTEETSYSLEASDIAMDGRRLLVAYGLVDSSDIAGAYELRLNFEKIQDRKDYGGYKKYWYAPDTRTHTAEEIFKSYLIDLGIYIRERTEIRRKAKEGQSGQ